MKKTLIVLYLLCVAAITTLFVPLQMYSGETWRSKPQAFEGYHGHITDLIRNNFVTKIRYDVLAMELVAMTALFAALYIGWSLLTKPRRA